MKKKTFIYIGLFLVVASTVAMGAARYSKAKSQPQRRQLQKATAAPAPAPAIADDGELRRALALANQKNYLAASQILYNLSRHPRYIDQRPRIKYVLGLMLFEMKLYQVSAFQFVDVIRDGKSNYVKSALEKLSIVADFLSDDTLLNYAIGKINIDDFPRENQDMLRFRIGEYLMRKEKYLDAAENLKKVGSSSVNFPKAKYLEGLAFAKSNHLPEALRAFTALAENRKESGFTDTDRVAAVMGMARVAYQMQKWDLAIDLYRQIPRDTQAWHESIFELSWAHMRAAHFRSVLSLLHTLHSPYYDEFYIPESILLRGLVYLYICRYDEMEKTLEQFEKIYRPVQVSLNEYTATHDDAVTYYLEIDKVAKNFDSLKSDLEARRGLKVPYLVARTIMNEGDFKRIQNYINQLKREYGLIQQLGPKWKSSNVGSYATQVLKGRMGTAQKQAGSIARNHMKNMMSELSELFEQYSFGRYEMINGKKEALKKKIQRKTLEATHIDDSKNRDFYIQNGFEYWPFEGEYWLNELGDYQFLGTQGCE